jgi:Tol biopolymer transport system component
VRLIRSLAVIALVAGSLAGCEWITNASHACGQGARNPMISGTGRYVVFSAVCVGDPVTGGPLNGVGAGPLGLSVEQLYVRDLRTGVTTGVTYATDGGPANNAVTDAAVSDDGQRVVFASSANNLVPGDTNDTGDVFVRDLVTGVTTRLSETSVGVQGNRSSSEPSMTADGRTVSFVTQATNLVPGAPTGGGIYLVDVASRAISLALAGGAPSFPLGGIAPDGGRLLMTHYTSVGTRGLFVRDLQTGVETRVDIDRNGGEPDGEPMTPSISAGGRFVAWTTNASDIVNSDGADSIDVFVRDLSAGTTRRVSAPITGLDDWIWAQDSQISRDGRFVGFWVSAPDYNGLPSPLHQYYVADLHSGTIAVASATADGTPSDWGDVAPSLSLSGDGRYLAFASDAKNLDDNDDGVVDIYVRFVVRPKVTASAPTSIPRGATTTVTLSGTGFISGAAVPPDPAPRTTIAVSGAGLTVNSVTVVDAKTLKVSISAAASAATGPRDVTPSNPGTGPGPGADRGSTGPTCAGCLTVTG